MRNTNNIDINTNTIFVSMPWILKLGIGCFLSARYVFTYNLSMSSILIITLMIFILNNTIFITTKINTINDDIL
mgnify:CR=1 FL=1